MSADDATFRQISDTARWVAVYRALESERPDAAFRDPFARRLAGERGEQIAASMTFASRNSWPFVARTWLIDQFVAEQVRRGVDMVVNLAAGLDARPYRMELPPSLSWIEVDLPEILAHKEEVLRDEKPNCAVARVRLDLSNVAARRELFSTLGGRARRAAIVAEGLLVYLADDDVASLARDLSACPTFGHLDHRFVVAVLAANAGKEKDERAPRSGRIPLEICALGRSGILHSLRVARAGDPFHHPRRRRIESASVLSSSDREDLLRTIQPQAALVRGLPARPTMRFFHRGC